MLHQIGIGALGPVFRTYEPTRDRLVAVKVFRLDIVPEQAQALANALTRATQASLFHPSIVEPIAAGVEGTVAYRAEEYVAAESLDVAMRHYAPAPLEKALPYVAQLAGAIDFARAAGVGHGGLHPRDIFITPDEARATGFGIVEALEQVGIRAPTRRPYAAPERIDGGPWSTPADVFSLAAITFELLTGRRPSGTGAQIGALPEGAHSGALHAVLARAMDDDPAKRFSTALGFAGALEAAGRGEAAPPPPAVAVSAAPAVAPIPPVAPPLETPSPMAAAPRPSGPPVAPLPPVAPPPVAAVPPVVSLPPATPPVRPAVPTPGEFEVEKQVDPILAAIDENMAAEHELDDAVDERNLFDPSVIDAATAREPEDSHAGPVADLGDVEPDRFTDDFVDEQEADAEARRPLEASLETAAPAAAAAEAPMFRSFDSSPESDDRAVGERSHVLPYAMLVVGLLVGFGAAYFLFGRDRVPPAGAPAAARPPQAAPAPSGAATPEKPGQYSEQKVTAPPPGGKPPAVSAAPPPAAGEKAAPARPAAAPPRHPEPAPTRGRLVVTSTPPRAAVTVNGKWRGRTPLTLDDLPFGRYTVRVVQPGYIIARDEFSLSARDASHEFAARLYRDRDSRAAEPAPRPGAPRTPAAATPDSFTGSLFVDSRPRGATVFVDGRSMGQTPLSIPGVPVGAHVVRLELVGKKTWSMSTRVTSGQTARVTGSLEDR